MNGRPVFAGWVTACVPHFACQRYVCRAVESLLAQSYPWVRVIVINDGDANPPWRALAHMSDPRLVRFDLCANRGAYFCCEVARRASPDPYFMVQDADDWAAPTRVAVLIELLQREATDLAVSAQQQFCEGSDGASIPHSVRWHALHTSHCEPFMISTKLDASFQYRLPHMGLFRSRTLALVGGYHGGVRVAWDVLLTNLMLMVGRVSCTPEPLYWRLLRADSLTHADETAPASAYARDVSRALSVLYAHCYKAYRAHRDGSLTYDRLTATIRSAVTRVIPPAEARHLVSAERRLRAAMQ